MVQLALQYSLRCGWARDAPTDLAFTRTMFERLLVETYEPPDDVTLDVRVWRMGDLDFNEHLEFYQFFNLRKIKYKKL